MAKVQRSKILLLYSEGKRITVIQLGNRHEQAIDRICIDKALALGPLQALKDLSRPGRTTIITDDAKAWVLPIACQKPAYLCYASETWTYSLLVKHIRKHCQGQGHSCIAKLAKGDCMPSYPKAISNLTKSAIIWNLIIQVSKKRWPTCFVFTRTSR